MADYPDPDFPDPNFDFLTPELLRHCVDVRGMDDFDHDADWDAYFRRNLLFFAKTSGQMLFHLRLSQNRPRPNQLL